MSDETKVEVSNWFKHEPRMCRVIAAAREDDGKRIPSQGGASRCLPSYGMRVSIASMALVAYALAGEGRSDIEVIVVRSSPKPAVVTSDLMPTVAANRVTATKIIDALKDTCEFLDCRLTPNPQLDAGLSRPGFCIVFKPICDLNDPVQAHKIKGEIEDALADYECEVSVVRTIFELQKLAYDYSEMAHVSGWDDDALVAFDRAIFGRKLSKSGPLLAEAEQHFKQSIKRPTLIGRGEALRVSLVDKREYQRRLSSWGAETAGVEAPEAMGEVERSSESPLGLNLKTEGSLQHRSHCNELMIRADHAEPFCAPEAIEIEAELSVNLRSNGEPVADLRAERLAARGSEAPEVIERRRYWAKRRWNLIPPWRRAFKMRMRSRNRGIFNVQRRKPPLSVIFRSAINRHLIRDGPSDPIPIAAQPSSRATCYMLACLMPARPPPIQVSTVQNRPVALVSALCSFLSNLLSKMHVCAYLLRATLFSA